MQTRVIVALAVVAAVALLLVGTRGKNCHYNAHFAKRVVCTKVGADVPAGVVDTLGLHFVMLAS